MGLEKEREVFNDAISHIVENEGKTSEQKAKELKDLVEEMADSLIKKR